MLFRSVNYVGDVDHVSVSDPVGMELAALRRELDDLLALREEENRNIL